jgi:hypothetical protein
VTAPERHRTLAEVCDIYFPGVTPCALRWMIKRRGYAHSRWGREYRLTDSQVAAIQADIATPARPAAARQRTAAGPQGNASTVREGRKPPKPEPHGGAKHRAPRSCEAAPSGDPRRALAERLARLPPATAVSPRRSTPEPRRQGAR